MRVKKLILQTTEGQSFAISGNYIGNFRIRGIYNNLQRFTYDSVESFAACESFYVEIHKSANKALMKGDYPTLFERLAQGKDIAAITVTLINEDNGEETTNDYYVAWKQPGETNEYQTSLISDLGHFYLCIDPEGDVYQYLDEIMISDEAFVDFEFKLYGLEKRRKNAKNDNTAEVAEE